MKERKTADPNNQPGREPFITIDDLLGKSQELYEGLKKLSEYRHPLGIRRGVAGHGEGVGDVAKEDELSRTVKAGSKTYFFDIKETKENKPYLLITESRFKGEGEERERVTIAIFPENAQDFLEAASEMLGKII